MAGLEPAARCMQSRCSATRARRTDDSPLPHAILRSCGGICSIPEAELSGFADRKAPALACHQLRGVTWQGRACSPLGPLMGVYEPGFFTNLPQSTGGKRLRATGVPAAKLLLPPLAAGQQALAKSGATAPIHGQLQPKHVCSLSCPIQRLAVGAASPSSRRVFCQAAAPAGGWRPSGVVQACCCSG
jgi:hypothetical protein